MILGLVVYFLVAVGAFVGLVSQHNEITEALTGVTSKQNIIISAALAAFWPVTLVAKIFAKLS